ncbi:MAG: CinA family protein [Pseudomonadota bacterium]
MAGDVDAGLVEPARQIIKLATDQQAMIAAAESCTGGLIMASLTSIAGSSSAVDRGFVTYTNEAKQEQLGVPPSIIETYGAVSQETAEAMVHGVFKQAKMAEIAVSVTGIAGPGGGSDLKPVGLVYIGYGRRGGEIGIEKCLFDGDRATVRHETVLKAFSLIEGLLGA